MNLIKVFTDECNVDEEVQKEMERIIVGYIEPEYDNPILSYFCGMYFYKKLNDNEKARTYLLNAIDKCNPDDEIFKGRIGTISYHMLGMISKKQENYDDAIKFFTIAADRNHISAMNQLGLVYNSQGDKENAIKYFTLGHENGCPFGMYNLGLVYQEANDLDLAASCFLICVDNKDYDAFSRLGIICEKKGTYSEAINWYKQALEKGDMTILNNFCKLCEKTNRSELYIYNQLSKLPPTKEIMDKMKKLEKMKSVFCFKRKAHVLEKEDECMICLNEKTKLIPMECCHYYCYDCYSTLKKCALCEF